MAGFKAVNFCFCLCSQEVSQNQPFLLFQGVLESYFTQQDTISRYEQRSKTVALCHLELIDSAQAMNTNTYLLFPYHSKGFSSQGLFQRR